MTTLDDAWRWYTVTRGNLLRMNRLARRHWSGLPWDGDLGRDDQFRSLHGSVVTGETRYALDHLDDLAVVVLFSVFESAVRSHVAEVVSGEAGRLTHPVLRKAGEDALWVVAEGSFARVLEPFKTEGRADLIEEVNQVRRYRNWVAHGRRGDQPLAVSPKTAYDRLGRCLMVLIPAASDAPPGDEP